MRRADRDRDRRLPDGHRAQAMRDADPRQAVLGHGVPGDRGQSLEGEGRIGGVAELRDGAAVEGVAGRAEEEHVGARGGGANVGENRSGVERGVGQFDVDVGVREVQGPWVG